MTSLGNASTLPQALTTPSLWERGMAHHRIDDLAKRGNRWKRFEKRISYDQHTGCWNWDKVAVRGYGASGIYGQRCLAHRAVYIFLRGPVPLGLDLDHLCRNRLCVNPDHLEPVTRTVNLQRGFDARGCKNGHPYTLENSSVVHHGDGKISRRCKLCHRATNKKAKLARRMREARC